MLALEDLRPPFTGVSFHILLQGIFPTQELSPGQPTPVLLPGKSHRWRSLDRLTDKDGRDEQMKRTRSPYGFF